MRSVWESKYGVHATSCTGFASFRIRYQGYLVDDSTRCRLCFGNFQWFSANHIFVGSWSNLRGLLYQTVEQLAPRSRGSPVKSKRKFVQVVVEVFRAHSSLMRAQQPTLE